MNEAFRETEAEPVRRIRLVADDYGISPAVNAAIRDLIGRGRLNATSVMVAAPSFDQAEADKLAALRAHAQFSIGLHVTLTAPFAPLSAHYAAAEGAAFLPLAATALGAMVGRLDRGALIAECTAQLEAFAGAFGQAPDFVDGHQHVQLFAPIGDALLHAMKRAAPDAWVRQCGRAMPWHRGLADRKGVVLDILSGRFRRQARAAAVPTNPAFAGTYDFRPDADFSALFAGFLTDLPEAGVIMCHPGMVDAELERLDPLTSLREREYQFLAGDGFAETMRRHRAVLA